MVTKIFEIVDRVFPSKEEREELDTIIVNERLMIACRVSKVDHGYTLFFYDQITGNGREDGLERYVDRNKALAAARAAVGLDKPLMADSVLEKIGVRPEFGGYRQKEVVNA